MSSKKNVNNLSREEDYRDYDTRNIDDGWPYADQAGATAGAVDNAAYGDPSANFDRERNKGFMVDSADETGLEERIKDRATPATQGLEDDDDLEERVTDAIDALDLVPLETIDIRADGTTVTLEGTIDDDDTMRRLIGHVRRMPGVSKVVNNLTLAGVDTHIPDDDDE
ncbi:BON domain-containing protein [Rhizobium oryzicola]|uniref:BON domain-containing protein n=1 Tax=Rhizobium oryzicola TaxID=1232668 RepID=A0ABT8SZ39_9HYPH|nr:BON domain-containing protein [Rhizobium oryzicola]MDO1583739.1 BON domain-containing protein [Rhizobium oryzicola]